MTDRRHPQPRDGAHAPVHPAKRRLPAAGLALLVLAGLLLLGRPASATDEPPVQPGTVLSVEVLEEDDYELEVRVSPAGRIVLPLAGELAVAGLRLAEVTALIEKTLRESEMLLSPTVVVEVVRYRSVYVGGAVERPGAVEFEPGLTVRHAVILAGGLALDENAERFSLPDLLSLRARLEAVAFRLMQVEGRIARLRVELDEAETIEEDVLDGALPGAREARAVLEMEKAFLSDRAEERRNREGHLQSLEHLIDLEIGVLEQQEALQEDERVVQREELDNARNLVKRGLMPLPRLQELRREKSRLSRDLLETRSFRARARQNLESVRNDRDTARLQWRIDVREKLTEALAERARLEAEVRSLTASMMVAGGAFATEPRDRAPVTRVTIFRQTGNGGEDTIDGRMGTVLVPGDVVSVSVALGPEG